MNPITKDVTIIERIVSSVKNTSLFMYFTMFMQPNQQQIVKYIISNC